MAGFQSKKWDRCVLDCIAFHRGRKHKGATFLVSAVATDMSCFADACGLLFRSEEDTAAAIGASASNVREARRFLRSVGLIEVSDVPKDNGKPRRRGRSATTFRLVMASEFRLHEGGNSARMGAEKADGITAPNSAGIAAPMGAATDRGTDKGTQGPQGPVSHSISSDSVLDDQRKTDVNGDFVAREGDKSPSSSPTCSDEENPQNTASEEDGEPLPELDPEDCDLGTITDAPPPNEIADQWAEADEQQEAPDPTEGLPDEWPGEDVQYSGDDEREDYLESDADYLAFCRVSEKVLAECDFVMSAEHLLEELANPMEHWTADMKAALLPAFARALEAPAARAGAVRHIRRSVLRLVDGDKWFANRIVSKLLAKVEALPPAAPKATIKPRPDFEEAVHG